jgi:hypothetical protein
LPPSLKLRRPKTATPAKPWRSRVAGMTPRSRREHRARYSFIFRPLQTKGAGNAGRPMRPIAACAMVVGRSAHALVRSHRNHPAFPTQWFTDYGRALPGARALWPPSPVKVSLHGLDTSVEVPGPHVFSVRLRRHSSKAPSASTASRPALLTLRNAPLVGRDGKQYRIIRIF